MPISRPACRQATPAGRRQQRGQILAAGKLARDRPPWRRAAPPSARAGSRRRRCPAPRTTTSDLRLPPPMRTSVLLPQPEASTMPKPNSSPPTSAESQMKRGRGVDGVGGLHPAERHHGVEADHARPWRPAPTGACATSRPWSSMSETAPMVQKWCAARSRRKTARPARTRPQHAAASAAMSMSCMPRFLAGPGGPPRGRQATSAKRGARAGLRGLRTWVGLHQPSDGLARALLSFSSIWQLAMASSAWRLGCAGLPAAAARNEAIASLYSRWPYCALPSQKVAESA